MIILKSPFSSQRLPSESWKCAQNTTIVLFLHNGVQNADLHQGRLSLICSNNNLLSLGPLLPHGTFLAARHQCKAKGQEHYSNDRDTVHHSRESTRLQDRDCHWYTVSGPELGVNYLTRGPFEGRSVSYPSLSVECPIPRVVFSWFQ